MQCSSLNEFEIKQVLNITDLIYSKWLLGKYGHWKLDNLWQMANSL